jgi:hypothetical protein
MKTKEEYLKAVSKHKENAFAKFMLNKFLRHKKMNVYQWILISIFIVSNIVAATLLQNNNKPLATIFCLIGVGFFASFGLLLFIAIIMDIFKTKQLCKELECNINELNMYDNIYNNK